MTDLELKETKEITYEGMDESCLAVVIVEPSKSEFETTIRQLAEQIGVDESIVNNLAISMVWSFLNNGATEFMNLHVVQKMNKNQVYKLSESCRNLHDNLLKASRDFEIDIIEIFTTFFTFK